MLSPPVPLDEAFVARDSVTLAAAMVGKVLRRRVRGLWLGARIVETEAYSVHERASHSSLGRTPAREPMFDAPGTLYLYWSRGGPSMNVSADGPGDAVLCKAALPIVDGLSPPESLDLMHTLNPAPDGGRRPDHRLCSGQALLCRALDLRVAEWTGRRFDPQEFLLQDDVVRPALVQARRLGIPAGRDEHLPWRFVDREHARSATRNPLTVRGATEGVHYWVSRSPPD